MQIKVISSSSAGNAVWVSDGETNLLFDAGLTYSKLSRKVKFSEIEAVFISHEHADHSKAVPELMRRGVNVYMSWGTAKEILPEVDLNYYMQYAEHLQQLVIGTWKVLPFDVQHDSAEPLGFLFESTKTGKRGLYIVDSALVNFDFKRISHFLIEANYQDELLEAGDYHEAVKQRVRQNHFSLDNLKVFLRTSDLSETEEIWLLHMSSANSHEANFIKEIQELTGVPVYT